MFLKYFARENANFFLNKGGVKGVLCENILSANLSGSQHLFEILQISLTVKSSENVVKS